MFKTIFDYSLPEGVNPDEFWKYHTEVHARDVMKAAGPGLKKYVINRVVKTTMGKPKFFGLIEMWWDSEESAAGYFKRQQAVKTATGKTPIEDFHSRVAPGSFGAVVLEKVIIP